MHKVMLQTKRSHCCKKGGPAFSSYLKRPLGSGRELFFLFIREDLRDPWLNLLFLASEVYLRRREAKEFFPLIVLIHADQRGAN
jgi:hypothetical protein